MSEKTEPQIEQRAPQPYVGTRHRVTNGVVAVVDRAFPELFAWLGEHGVEPAGPPFIRYRENDTAGEPLELEVGVPVAAPPSTDGDVRADALPAGRYVTFVHVGPYRSSTVPDLGAARAALAIWLDDHGIACRRDTDRGSVFPCCVEQYRIGPVTEPDYSKWETEFAYLIVDG